MQQLFKSCTLFNDLSTVHTNLTITNFERERWNNDYEALNFAVGKQRIKSRLAKKTPKKQGILLLYGIKTSLLRTYRLMKRILMIS